MGPKSKHCSFHVLARHSLLGIAEGNFTQYFQCFCFLAANHQDIFSWGNVSVQIKLDFVPLSVHMLELGNLKDSINSLV